MVKRDKKILVVEDNEEIQYILTGFLKTYGFTYASAYSVDEGLEKIKRAGESKYNLVLLDLLFPEKNGLYFINEIRSNMQYENLKIIVISTLNEKSVILKALELGAEDYISKPIDNDILSDKINTLLSDTHLYSLPVLGTNPDAQYAPIEFDFDILLGEIDEDGAVFYTDCALPKNYVIDVSLNIFSDPMLQRVKLKVISTQVVHGAVKSYEIITKFCELSIEQQLMIRKWLLTNGRYEKLL